ALDWPQLEAAVAGCNRCRLCQGRTQTVFGVGDRQAAWMVVGEAPGAEEDRQGEPFVGAAGQLLNQMLRAVGLARESVFIANTLKCRPPGNRDPQADELAACRPYLERQIALVQPRLLLAVGRIASQALLGSAESMGRLRGRVHTLPGTTLPLVATYHPAYLLRSPLQKRLAWQDLLLARRVVAGEAGGDAG
ncbi:MAG TPA: uracil-DNA glycosylase, partial [Gammaproteobacteria bacterium]